VPTLLEPTTDSRPAAATPDRPATPIALVRPAIVYAILFGSVGAYFPYISVFFASLGFSLEIVGALTALNAAVGLFAAPSWGAVADRLRDVRAPVLIGGLVSAAGAAWLATADTPLTAALAVAVLAAGSAGLGPMLDSRTIELLGASRDRFGIARAWGSFGFIVVAIAVGAVIGRLGPAGLFLVLVPGAALAGVVGAVLMGGGSRRARVVTAVHRGRAFLDVLRSPGLRLLFVAEVVLWTAVSAAITFVSLHMVRLGGGPAEVGALWSIGAFVEVPLMLVFPRLVGRIGPGRLVLVGATAFALRATGWSLAPEPSLLLAVAPLGGVGFAFTYVGTVMFVARAVPPSIGATAQGLFTGTTFSLGSILGAIAGGQLATALGIPGMFAVSSALAFAAATGIWWSVGRGRARQA
jgi:MFS transporter, PPP family, 3-phenylpropionic acid transporter